MPRDVHVGRHARRRIYDPVRAEWYSSETGLVEPAPTEGETGRLPRPTHRELSRAKYRIVKDVRSTAAEYLRALGYSVGGASEAVGAPPGIASDRDLLDEATIHLRRIVQGGMPHVPRRGVAGAVVIVALERRRARMASPTELADRRTAGALAFALETDDPDDEGEIISEADVEADDIRRALRVVRERLRR